jgi:uncharacterized protein (TIGR04255 family)
MFDRLNHRYSAEPIQEGQPMPVPGNPLAGPVPGLQMQMVFGIGVPGRVRLSSPDQKSLLLISPNAISVSVLDPYPGWELFSQSIKEALDAFSSIATGPISVERIGLRYINRVDSSVTSLADFFNLKPLSFGELSLVPKNFVSRSELLVHGQSDRLVIATFSTASSQATGTTVDSLPGIILDLDVVAQNLDEGTGLDQGWELVKELRDIEKQAFEAAITDTARDELFGGFEERPE